LNSETEKKKCALFDELIEKRCGTSLNPLIKPPFDDSYIVYANDDEGPRLIIEIDDPIDAMGRDID